MTYFIINNEKKLKQFKVPQATNETKNWKVYLFIILVTAYTILNLIRLSTWAFFDSTPTNNDLNAELDFSVHTVSEYYLSFAIDATLLRKMNKLPIINKQLIDLTRHLSPAYVRYGGTSADCLFFNETLITPENVDLVNGQNISKFTISEKDFQSLYEFSKKSKLRMIFDLNVLIRNPDGSWNDSNAVNIIKFAKNQKMDIDWQLGNEPPNFPLLFNLTIPPEQLAKDYHHLRSLLNSMGFKDSILVGPEVNQVGGPFHHGENYTKIFLKHSGNTLNYITWHQYYLRGEDAKMEDFVNVTTFNYLPYLIKSMQEAVDSSGNKIPMWLSETSTAYDEGAPGISDRFVAGFLWLDKLGYSAKVGIQVIIRQSLFGQNYGMISTNLTPNPDWWVSVLYKKLVSNKVLNISDPFNFGYVRLYHHCTPEKIYPNSITIFGVNIDGFPRTISFSNIPTNSESEAFLYLLTSDNLLTRSIRLNGKKLKLLPYGNLPGLKPISLGKEKNYTLPSFSMFFLVVNNVNIAVCLNSL